MNDQADQSPTLYVPFMAGFYERTSCLAWPLVRVVTGLFMMPHGAGKLFGMFGGSIDGTAGFFAKIGLEPALPLAYLVGMTEFFGGLLLVLGFLTRPAAAAAATLMLVAAFKVHLGNGFFWNQGGYEYPLMWACMAIAIFIRGGGACSIDSKIGKEF